MTNRELEQKVRSAAEHASPDVLDTVLRRCDERKGEIIPMTQGRKRSPWARRLAGIAAALVLVVGGLTGFGAYQSNYAVAATVSLDVNPSIRIEVNEKDRVLAVTPLNEEGRQVTADMDFEGSHLDVAVNALIGSMLRNGYITELANSILVSVDGRDGTRTAELQAQLSDEINALLQMESFSGAVLSQVVTTDDELRALADTYGITLGKAQLIRQITQQNAHHSFAELVSLSINELNLISEGSGTHLSNVSATGSASDKGYIGEAAAKAAALAHAGISEAGIARYRAEMDYEHGRMVYEIEFSSAGTEYDYDIDALTGEVLTFDREWDDDAASSPAVQQPAAQPSVGTFPSQGSQTSGSYVGEETAKTAALAHAGVSEVHSFRCELDREDGQMVYEIEFSYGGYEFDYEIDAATGAVLRYDREYDD